MMQASFTEAAERGMWLQTEGIPEVIVWEGAPQNSSFYLDTKHNLESSPVLGLLD